MNCSPFDLRDYCLDELNAGQRREVESHVASCAGCREELDRLRLTRQALLRLPEAEIPRRIAFVSDKVFEPAWYARWWAALPRLAFGLAVLAAVFFAGAWSERRHQVELTRAIQALETRHDAQMRGIAEAFDMVERQMNDFYRRAAEARPATYRQ
jgi:anti-sigma factor RsiW